MPLIQCPECQNQISNSADKCPHCGKRLKGVSLLRIGVMGCFVFPCILVAGFVLLGVIGSLAAPVIVKKGEINSTVQSYPLELKSWNWGESYEHAIAEGLVKNISSQPIRNLEVVVSYYDSKDNFITSDSTLIDYNPILPGQASPFKSITTWNPAMAKASVDFKPMFGTPLPYKENTKNVKR